MIFLTSSKVIIAFCSNVLIVRLWRCIWMRQQGQPYCHITISSGQGTVRYVVPVCQAKKEGHSKGAEERRKHGRGHSVIRGLDTAGQWFRRKSCNSPMSWITRKVSPGTVDRWLKPNQSFQHLNRAFHSCLTISLDRYQYTCSRWFVIIPQMKQASSLAVAVTARGLGFLAAIDRYFRFRRSLPLFA